MFLGFLGVKGGLRGFWVWGVRGLGLSVSDL